jgi:hypothetical protein
MTVSAPLLKVADVARKTGYSGALIMRLARGGLIPAFFISKRTIRFDPKEDYKKLIFKATLDKRIVSVVKMKKEDAENGKDFCEACGWKPGHIVPRGYTLLEHHHVIPLRYGGHDDKKNMVRLCPTCHKVAHKLFPHGVSRNTSREEYLLEIKTQGENSYRKALEIVKNMPERVGK